VELQTQLILLMLFQCAKEQKIHITIHAMLLLNNLRLSHFVPKVLNQLLQLHAKLKLQQIILLLETDSTVLLKLTQTLPQDAKIMVMFHALLKLMLNPQT
jgi:hypothetical protein